MNGTTTAQLAEKTAKAVTGSVEEWTGFLQSAARLYKYSYPEQLLIYAQRPDATACASYEIWNQTMRRYVRRGARGIALPDGAGAVRYVFDVADTGARKSSREVKTWALDENNREAVAHALETQYGSAAKLGIAGQLEEIAMQQSMDYWQWHQDELRGIVDGSFLEGYDELNLEIAFRNTAAASVKYMLLSRCNLAREYQIEPEELAGVLEWNTSAASGALGSAVSELSEGVLRQIERTIRQYERSQNHDERTDVYEERRVLDSRSDSSRTADGAEQIRTDAGMVSEGASDDHLQQPAPERKIDRAPDGDRPGGGESDGGDRAEAGEAGGRDGSAESERPDALGRADEHLQGAGRRNRNERADLRLNRQMSLFPTEAEQIQSLEEADEREVSASFLMEKATDVVLRFGGNNEEIRMELTFDAIIDKPIDEIAAHMRTLYHGGSGFELEGRRFSAWYADNGIYIAGGDRARYANTARIVSWKDAAKRVGERINAGRFGTELENVEAAGFVRRQVASRLIEMYRESFAGENGYLPLIREQEPMIFPDCVNRLFEKMEQPDNLHELIRQVEAFAEAVERQPDLMRMRFFMPDAILPRLRDLTHERRELPKGERELPEVRGFITQDEIDWNLTGGSGYESGAERIELFFSQPHDVGEKIEFLKREYGTGGRMPGVSNARHSEEWHDTKGIQLRKNGCQNVTLGWNKVAERIDTLIRNGRYTRLKEQKPEEEIRLVPDMEAYRNLKVERPQYMVGVRVDDYLLFYGEDAKTAAPLLNTKLLERDIPGVGMMPVTGIPFGRWSVAAKTLTENGQSIFFAEPAEQGGYEVVKELNGRRDTPHYQVGDTVYLDDKAFLIEQITDIHVQLRDPTLRYPVIRTERREIFEQMLAENTRNDELFYRQREAMPAEPENFVLMEELPNTPEPQQPQEETKLHSVVTDLTGQESRQRENEQLKAQNFRITDEHLGEGSAKTKFGYNIAAIQTLKQIEAEGRQARPDEQEILSRYVGWGGIPQAFDEENTQWSEEYRQLKELLTEKEYDEARSSTLNAHYTSPTVIRAMYDAIEKMGFRTGNVLEPSCGVGNFFGMLPDDMSGSRLYGVELDSITGRIARQLYPDARITISGFEKTQRRDFFDLAIGNVPFGGYKVSDKQFDKYNFLIHDYFFAKTLEQVRPGGVIAYITSKGTMDKASPDVRRYIAQRAELLGAIRLPNTAFAANAGTSVTTDILFLQKRESPIDIEPDWVHLGQTEDGIPINSYFVSHPDMMLGSMAWDKSMYGDEKETTCRPIPGADLKAQLEQAIQKIGGEYHAAEVMELAEGEEITETLPADPDVKNYSYTIVDGEVYFRENSVMMRPKLNRTAQERVKSMVALRDTVYRLMNAQLEDADDETIENEQRELNRQYDAFSTKFGLINDRANRLAFSDDSSYYLLSSLEVLDEDRKLERKADMFTKRTIRRPQAITHTDTAAEALAVSIGEKARVDLPYMAELTGKNEDAITKELTGVIYLDPESQTWQTADEYLSGNVREKLRTAQAAAKENMVFMPNVDALQAVQPKDLDASEIDVRLGATWISPKDIDAFMYELFSTQEYMKRYIQVNFSQFTGEWNISGKTLLSRNDVAVFETYGTSRANAYKILEDTLNLRDVRIYDTVQDADGKEKRVLNSKDTTLAQQKQQAIKDAFREWIWKEPNRRYRLVKQYNELFNATRPREYDGSHIVFAGMNPEITLREHQKNAIARMLYGGNTLLAHEVGSGKTFEMIAGIMESKRLGLCTKSMIVVPNHLTEQWSAEFLRLYPGANILVATKRDFEKGRRKRFCSRIATGNYDAVIIGQSQAERIPISRERQERIIRDQIAEITDGIAEIKHANGERFTIKQLERSRKQLEARLERLKAEEKKDDVITFEQLGVDRLVVDEAHSYKNMFLYTKMRNVAGLSTSEAQKSSDMFAKCRYMDELTDGHGIIFATGTPVSNSMTELFTMQRYLQYETLRKQNLTNFDAWASVFGETVTAIELAPEGTGYRARTRFAKFYNLPELMNMFREVADIKTADQLHLPTPNAHYETVVVQPSEIQKRMVQELSKRAAKIHGGAVDPHIDNMLKVSMDGKKLGLDQRLINPMLPDDPGSKVNACVGNVMKIYREGSEQKLTQLIFSDMSTPKNGQEKEFSVYDDIREKLLAQGVPESEIAFIHNADTEAKKKELFAKVRTGQVRILLGSTAKMGAGTNVQDRLIASHDLDCPWRPGDLEQRAGRIVRQGNRNADVYVYRYVTDGTFDAYSWQTIENKQKFISQVMTSKSPVRVCDDVDESVLSYAEIKALCAGDARIREKMDLDVEVSRLKLMQADYQSKKYRLEDRLLRYFPQEIQNKTERIEGHVQDIACLQAHVLPEDGFRMEVGGKMYTEKEAAGQALIECCKKWKGDVIQDAVTYRGMSASLAFDAGSRTYWLNMHGNMTYSVELGNDPRGNITRIDNRLARVPDNLEKARMELQGLKQQEKAAKEELEKPFAQEAELVEKRMRLAQLNSELNIDDKAPIEAAIEDAQDVPSIREQLRVSSEREMEKRNRNQEREER